MSVRMRIHALILLILISTLEFGIGSQVILNESVESQKGVMLSKELYFVGEEIEIYANFLPQNAYLIDPTGNKTNLLFEPKEEGFLAKLKLEKNVILGEYRLIVDEIEKSFLIDFCELNATYNMGFLNLTARTFFSKPEFEFKIDSEMGKAFENVSIPLKSGKHEFMALCGNTELRDEVEVNFSIEFSEGKIYSSLDGKEVNAILKVLADREYDFQGSFSLEEVNSTVFTVEAEYLHLETSRSFNFDFGLKDLYFPGEEIVIHSELFEWAKILDPADREFNLNFENGFSRFRLEKDILLGEYRLMVAGIEKRFFIDSYSINASFKEGKIIGNVSYYFVEPEFVYYKLDSMEGKVRLSNGSFEIPISLPAGNYTALLSCGNAVFELNFSILGKDLFIEPLYSLGEKISLNLKFKPERALLSTPTKSIELNFTERDGFYYTEFIAEELGKHLIQIDDLSKEFLVDECKINAGFVGKEVRGNVSYHFSKPEFIEICEENCYKMKLEKEEFSFKTEVNRLILICRNAKLEVSKLSEKKELKTKLGSFKFSLDNGEFEKLDFKEEELLFEIKTAKEGKVKLEIEPPFEIPKGRYLYFWKDLCGKLRALDYNIEGEKFVFEFQDGLIDEDCNVNGSIVGQIKLQIPSFKVERKLESKKGLLKVEKDRSFEIKFESSGKIKYLAFVDPDNLPLKPAEFPYGLLKFEIEVEPGQEAEIRINYPSLEDLIGDEGKVTFYKFNPKTLEWKSFDAEVEGNLVILRFQDGGFGDEDGVVNGIISDDGGVGWVGYRG
ncbi:MAG: choice-of-anchor U domain-containing protein, partial [Archaeoglobaceae archaeon]